MSELTNVEIHNIAFELATTDERGGYFFEPEDLDKFVAEILAAQQQAEPVAATPSEDGREVPKFDRRAIADRVNRMCVLMAGANTLNAAEFAVEECQSELERIVAAKEAKIARFRRLHDAAEDHNHHLREELKELRAQPARQVGGDEREAFETWQIESGRTDPMWLAPEHFDDANNEYAFLDVQQDWAIWKACCAALAPAAVVMPERKSEIAPPPFERGYNAALDAVARLNRHAIPVDLLKRIAAPMPDERGWKTFNVATLVEASKELRALLGKS